MYDKTLVIEKTYINNDSQHISRLPKLRGITHIRPINNIQKPRLGNPRLAKFRRVKRNLDAPNQYKTAFIE
jgi:hypothetical protein